MNKYPQDTQTACKGKTQRSLGVGALWEGNAKTEEENQCFPETLKPYSNRTEFVGKLKPTVSSPVKGSAQNYPDVPRGLVKCMKHTEVSTQFCLRELFQTIFVVKIRKQGQTQSDAPKRIQTHQQAVIVQWASMPNNKLMLMNQ